MTQSSLRVDGLRKAFGTRAVLDGVSFEVRAGDAVALVGPSGSGKSTLLRCFTGLDNFDAGTITIGGSTLNSGHKTTRAALQAVRRKVGMVFQQWHIFGHLTARENIEEAPHQVLRLSRDDARARATALLAQVGLEHRGDALPRELSGGEQQRVAIARALAMQPEILFMDEPTSALDPERTQELTALLRTLSNDGLTVITVTHDIAFATSLASHAIVLVDGKVIEQGAPKSIFENPAHERTRAFLALAR